MAVCRGEIASMAVGDQFLCIELQSFFTVEEMNFKLFNSKNGLEKCKS